LWIILISFHYFTQNYYQNRDCWKNQPSQSLFPSPPKKNLRPQAWILDPKKVKKSGLSRLFKYSLTATSCSTTKLCCFFQGYCLKISCQVIGSWSTGRRRSGSRFRPCFSRGHPFHPLIMSSQLVTLQLEQTN